MPALLGGPVDPIGQGWSGLISRRRDWHFACIPSPSLLKRLLKGEGGAAE